MYTDEFGVEYSDDKKTLIHAPKEISGEYVIPDGVTKIGREAFDGCKLVQKITIPDSVIEMGEDAFYGCSSLTDIRISNSLEEIAEDAFYFCTSLDNVIIPNSVKKIGHHAFRKCTSLKSIAIPDSVENIGYCSFHSCSNLTDFVVGNSVKRIEEAAFRECTNLTSITIPGSVEEIGTDCFVDCPALKTINVPVGKIGEYKSLFPEYKDIIVGCHQLYDDSRHVYGIHTNEWNSGIYVPDAVCMGDFNGDVIEADSDESQEDDIEELMKEEEYGEGCVRFVSRGSWEDVKINTFLSVSNQGLQIRREGFNWYKFGRIDIIELPDVAQLMFILHVDKKEDVIDALKKKCGTLDSFSLKMFFDKHHLKYFEKVGKFAGVFDGDKIVDLRFECTTAEGNELDYAYGERLKAEGLIQDYSKIPSCFFYGFLRVVLNNGRFSYFDMTAQKIISLYGFNETDGFHMDEDDTFVCPCSNVEGKWFYIIPYEGEYYVCKQKKGTNDYTPIPKCETLSQYDKLMAEHKFQQPEKEK